MRARRNRPRARGASAQNNWGKEAVRAIFEEQRGLGGLPDRVLKWPAEGFQNRQKQGISGREGIITAFLPMKTAFLRGRTPRREKRETILRLRFHSRGRAYARPKAFGRQPEQEELRAIVKTKHLCQKAQERITGFWLVLKRKGLMQTFELSKLPKKRKFAIFG